MFSLSLNFMHKFVEVVYEFGTDVRFWFSLNENMLRKLSKERAEHHDGTMCYHSTQTAHHSLPSVDCSVSPFLFPSVECRAFLFVCSRWALPVDPVLDFPKADINITGHCDGVIFMEAPEEVTWLWLVPRGPRLSIKAVVLTHISINEVEKLRKWLSLWAGWGVFWAPILLMGPEYFPSLIFFFRVDRRNYS